MKDYSLDHEKILRATLSKGGDYADLFIETSALTAVQLEADKIERAQMGIDSGAGLRLVSGERTVYAYTNEITQSSLLELADSLSSALESGGNAGVKKLKTLKGNPPGEIKTDPAGVSIEEKVALAVKANDTARKLDERVRQVRVNFGDGHREIQIATSDGSLVEETRTQTVFLVHVVAADGDVVQTGYEPVGGARGMEIFDEYPPETIAEIAARRAILMLDSPPAPAGRMPVVLSSEAGGTMIHEAVGHGLEGDLASDGLSVYSDRIGEKLASELITVVDDATIPGARGSFGYDDEGMPAQKTVLIEDGVLKGYMQSRISAKKMGADSTGNGRREDYRHRPIVRMTNTMILPGKNSPEEIVRSVDKGLFVKKMGGGQVNTVNGDFVFEVTEGYLIENGQVGRPVRNATLMGNGPRILMEIDMVGTDLGYAIGTCGKDGQGAPVADAQPTLRIPEITVGGRNFVPAPSSALTQRTK